MKDDVALKAEVLAALRWDPSLIAKTLEVSVANGVVTLIGEVGSHAEKRGIECALANVPGIDAMVFGTDVVLRDGYVVSDRRLAEAVREALGNCHEVPLGHITTVVEQGWVTLRGSVAWERERIAAARVVREIAGVQGVTNALACHPFVTVGDVERNVQDALLREAQREGRGIEVHVDGGTVTLRGTVHSETERAAAQNAAWASPGVATVVNSIVVRP